MERARDFIRLPGIYYDCPAVHLAGTRDVVMGYLSYEAARRLFDDDVSKAGESIWKAHWKNAKQATTLEQMINLINNHLRLYYGLPSGSGFSGPPDHSEQRELIINFLGARIQHEFEIPDPYSVLKYKNPFLAEEPETDVVQEKGMTMG